jgi:hypothetical protein
MLPGFRFLFAAIVLSLSILVFGLGAAALLRAAHEEFASTPAWRGAPEMVFAQPVETRPVLALLRVDTPVAEKAADNAPADATPTAITQAPIEPERIAALKPGASPSPEPAKPEAIVAESPAQNEAASAPAEPPVAVAAAETKSAETKPPENKTADTKIAMSEDTASPANQAAAPAASEPAAPPTSPDATIAATKIATLGGPAVSIETPRPVKAESAKTDSAKTGSTKTGSNIIKKRQHARRAARRRLAARARLTAQLPLQQADPFGQPAPTIVRRR